ILQNPVLPRHIAAQYSPGIFSLNSNGLIQKGFRRQRNFVTRNKVTVIRAVAIPVQPAPVESAEYRKQLAEDYGFRQIGESLPDDVTLKDVINSLPKEVFEIDDVKAWKSVLISVTSYALGIFLISKAPWYLLPLAWAWTGTAITGFFVIGHDCAHKSFSSNKLVEDIVGTLAFMPLIYPYEPWRFKHDRHHAKTNMLKTTCIMHCKRHNGNIHVMDKILLFLYHGLFTRSKQTYT
ncbi:Omega-6 fatty acid desaturase, chloroplastic, partial [Glycine soja]